MHAIIHTFADKLDFSRLSQVALKRGLLGSFYRLRPTCCRRRRVGRGPPARRGHQSRCDVRGVQSKAGGGVERQTTNLGVWSSNLSGRAGSTTYVNFQFRQDELNSHSGAQLGAHDERLAPARRPRTSGDPAFGRQCSARLVRARRRRICRLMKQRSRSGRRRRSRRHSAQFSVSWPKVKCGIYRTHPNIRTLPRLFAGPRLSVGMFGSGGKKRAKASSNCAAL